MESIVRHRPSARPSGGRRFRPHPAATAMLLAGALAAAAPAAALPAGKLEVRFQFELRRDGARADAADIVPGEYLVAFGDGIAGPLLYAASGNPNLAAEAVQRSDAAERRLEMRRDGSAVLYRYRAALVGFAAKLTDEALAEIRRSPGVRIEPNRTAPAPRHDAPGELVAPASPLAKLASAPPSPSSCASAPRGLDRIDRRLRPCDGVFYATSKGTNVHVYVIDTGVASHSEFGSRVGAGYNATKDGKGMVDCLDHGTGVASVIGGKTLGVAPGVIIHPVRVFPCVGKSSTAALIEGIEWVAVDRVTTLAGLPAVVNVSFMALKGQKNSLLNNAIENSITVGKIPYVIAAGNDAVDACGVSPAMVGPAITVGNVKPENDRIMNDSNFGKCVDLFAPGVGIPVASRAGPNSKVNRDGTSFAAPHVTGVAALYLEKYPKAPPAAVWAAILNAANNNDIKPGTPYWCGIPNRNKGSPNVLLHWGSGSDDGILDALPKANAPPPPSC